MRLTFYAPPLGEITRGDLAAVLSLVGENVLPERLAMLTPVELVVAYDWAWRVHLRASDNLVRFRERPSFLSASGPVLVPGA